MAMPVSQQRPDPASSSSGRWWILLLTCLGIFGQFYAYDDPSALNEQLQRHMQRMTQAVNPEYDYYFSLLYTLYSLPNLVLPLLIGLAIDRYGFGALLCSLSAITCLGNAIFSVGVDVGSWSTMIAGRIVFGFGGESLQVAQNCLMFRWFKGNELAFAFAVNLAFGRSGSVLNDILSPWVASKCGVTCAVWLGTFLCLGSFFCNVWSVVMDKRESDARQLESSEVGNEGIYLQGFFGLSRLFWLLIWFSVVMYCGIMPFNNVASAFFVETSFAQLPLGKAQQMAGNAMSLMFLIVALCMAPFGALVDFVGLRAHFMLFSAVLLPMTYSLAFVCSPVVLMGQLGVVYTVFTGVWWPALALTVPKRQLGSAYGLATALQNGGLAVVPLIIGRLQVTEGDGNFSGVIQLLMRFGLVGVLLALWIMREDQVNAKVLSLPSARIRPRMDGPDDTTADDDIEATNESSSLIRRTNERYQGVEGKA